MNYFMKINIVISTRELCALAKKLKIEKTKKHQKWKIFGVSEELKNSVFSLPRIELFGDSKVLIEGCLGVYEYNDNYLKLRLQNGALILCGREFDIVSFEEKTITVKGKITSVEFCV